MHKLASSTAAAALMLLGSLAASAQEPSVGQSQQQSFPAKPEAQGQTTAPDHTVPPPPHAQPKAPIADQAGPAAVGPAQAGSADSTPGAAPLGATPQTMPSKISGENATLDKLPTTALQFPMTDAQKKLIAASLASTPRTQTAVDMANVHVAGFLPTGVPMQEFSGDLTQQYLAVSRYKYVKLDDRILIVDPANLTVVGEIKPQT